MKPKVLITGDGRPMFQRLTDACFKKQKEPDIAKCPFCSHKNTCDRYQKEHQNLKI